MILFIILVLFCNNYCTFVNGNCKLGKVSWSDVGQSLHCNSTSNLNDVNDLPSTVRETIAELIYTGTNDTKISAEPFQLPELRSLTIRNTNIQQIEGEAFANLEYLSLLQIDKNEFYKEIQPKTFGGVIQLKQLAVTSCSIESLRNDTFEGLGDLEALNLEDNRIRIIEANALRSLNNLIELFLDHNQIQQIPTELFLNTPKLTKLHLFENKIEKLSPNHFITEYITESFGVTAGKVYASSSLTHISLEGNQNFQLQKDNFQFRSKGLVFLDLSNIGLTTIPQNQNIFGSNLERLGLNKNNLTKLSNGVFDTLKNLSVLIIQENLIDSFDEDCFQFNVELTALDLAENHLYELSKNLFKSLTKLRHLILFKNRLRLIKHDDFDYLKNLKRLDLRNNKILYLLQGTFNHLKYLTNLLITENEIVMIQPKTFINLFSLTTLDLSYNKLQTIDKGIFDARNYENFSKLTAVIMYKNEISRLANDSFLPLVRVTTLDLDANKITEIESGAFQTMNMLKILNLRGNLLEVLPNELFSNLTNLIELNLFGNKLKIIPDLIFSNLKFLRIIDLSYNNLNYVSALAIKDSPVERFLINFNNLTFIDDEFFMNSPKMKQFVFYNNPIQCKCYFHMLNILTKLNISEGYDYKSKYGYMPVCTVTNFDKCVKDPNLNLEIFKFYHHMLLIQPKEKIPLVFHIGF